MKRGLTIGGCRIYLCGMVPDPLKDLAQLKNLFPDMEPYEAQPEKELPNEDTPLLTAKEKAAMKLYVSRDKKQRAGKTVTLIEGFDGPAEVLNSLFSALKSLCATGGSMKDGVLMIQGDHVKKVLTYLVSSGYKQTKQKGGQKKRLSGG